MYRRVYLIGESSEIARDPDGPKMVTAYSEDLLVAGSPEIVSGDPRPSPPPCGEKLARLFLDSILARFKLLAVGECHMGISDVSCPSHYLPSPYVKVYLYLGYRHVPAKLAKLELSVYQRGANGSVSQTILAEPDRGWYNGLYKDLRERAYCR